MPNEQNSVTLNTRKGGTGRIPQVPCALCRRGLSGLALETSQSSGSLTCSLEPGDGWGRSLAYALLLKGYHAGVYSFLRWRNVVVFPCFCKRMALDRSGCSRLGHRGFNPTQNAGASLYADDAGGALQFPEGFFGSIGGVPSNFTGRSQVNLVGVPGITVDGLLSNLYIDSLVVFKTIPSATFAISWTDTRNDLGMTDTIMSFSPAAPDTYQLLAMSLRSPVPFLVQYGTAPDAPIFPFDLTFQGTDGRVFPGSPGPLRFSGHGVLTFTNPTMGAFTRDAFLKSDSGDSSTHIVPEPGLLGLNALMLGWMLRKRYRLVREICSSDAEEASQRQHCAR